MSALHFVSSPPPFFFELQRRMLTFAVLLQSEGASRRTRVADAVFRGVAELESA